MARRSIVTRIALIAIATGLIGATGATISARMISHSVSSERLSELLEDRYDLRESRVCQAAPQSWQLPVSRNARAFAYDEATKRPQNPSAPPLRTDLYAQLPEKDDGSVVGFGSYLRGTVVLLRRRSASPCGLVQLTSEPQPTTVNRVLTAEVVGALATGLVSGLLALALGLPLAQRVRRLEASAGLVGTDDEYVGSRARVGGDELDGLGAALDKADARIRSDASLLKQQRTSLERHLSEVAHDLRTPLTSLHAALERATETPDPAGTAGLLASALFDVVYLSALTDNLRLASQLRDGWDPNQDRRPFDLRELIEHVGERARMLARRRNVTLDMAMPDSPLLVDVGRIAVEQALTNVVQNAVSYVDPGGHVAIVLGADAHEHGFTLDVRDDGPGVPPVDLPQLGHGTFRSDEARQRDPRGRGIGLAITSEVCRRFGWKLSFHALEPRGLGVRIRAETK
jgi:signal transduction histidine kinase